MGRLIMMALFVGLILGCGDSGEDSGGASAAPNDVVSGQDAQDSGGEDDANACVPQCADKECGEDGCGESCGDCPQAAPVCSEEQLCVPECLPTCDGLECGDDGCGGTCGDCPDDKPICGADQLCAPCTPDCEGKPCGDDGCGGSCGECPDYETCEGTNLSQFGEGLCVESEQGASCEYAESVTDCADEGAVCAGGQCVSTDPADYVFGSASSVITKLDYAAAAQAPACCFDFDGDGEVDNLIGQLMNTLASLLGDVAPEGPLQTGGLITLLNYQDLDDLTDDPQLQVSGFYSSSEVSDEAALEGGEAEFSVDVHSFIEGTALPKTAFDSATVEGGELVAKGAALWVSIDLGLPIVVPVENVLLTASVEESAGGHGPKFEGASLSGVLQRADLFDALNGAVADLCGCLGLQEALYQLDEADQSVSCTSAPESSCESGELCQQLSDMCAALATTIKGDLDTTGDDLMNAMSVGAWVDANGAVISGIASE